MPKNVKELHSFLSLASYYHQFLPNFTHMAKCLHQLIGLTNVKKTKGKKVSKEVTLLEEKKSDLNQPAFVWASEHQNAFDTLKVALNYSPSTGVSQFQQGIYPRNRCLTKRAGSCAVSSR